MPLRIRVKRYINHTAPNIGPSATFPSSSSTVNPINASSICTQNFTVPFVAKTKSVETFDGLDHQSTPEKNLHQIHTQLVFNMGENPPIL